MTPTTQERLLSIIGMNFTIVHDQRDIRVADHSKAAVIIAAEIDRLTAERDAAQAEIERLRPAAEAWRTLEAARKEERTGTDENEHAEYWVHILARNAARAADRARAAKEAQP